MNRWIIPLEDHVDYLTLNTGKKIEVPFKTLLISTPEIFERAWVYYFGEDAAMRRRLDPEGQSVYAVEPTSPSGSSTGCCPGREDPSPAT